MSDEGRYSRNTALFGDDGQKRIFEQHVLVAGLGGLGSHVAQQLAFLGVQSFALADPDPITESSLNRVVGATPDDWRMSAFKVDVAARMIRLVQPEASVAAFATGLDHMDVVTALRSCNSVFSCLDNDAGRLALVELCARRGIPYFDLATDTGSPDSGVWYGGRVLFSGEGERCPSCMDLVDQVALTRASMTPAERDVDRRIYGVSTEDLVGYGPSVIGLNGVVASLATVEWMALVTGLRAPVPLAEYRGQQGAVFVNTDEPRGDCFYCSLWPRRSTAA